MKIRILALPGNQNASCCSWRLRAYVFCTLIMLTLCIANANAEVIRQFNADIRLNPDCSLDVIEMIQMDFENSHRHGIFRIIPVQYTRYGGTYSLPFHLFGVTDEQERPLNYVESRMGSDVNIKIGDAQKLLTGQHTYFIHYLVRRAVNFFNGVPEVYWNGTGNDWPFTIKKTKIRFYPPQGVDVNNVKAASYSGPIGSTNPGEIRKSNESIEFQAANLSPGSGLTMVAQLPPDCVIKPPLWREIAWFLMDWWALIAIPIFTSLCLLPTFIQHTRDPNAGKAIAVEWNPPKDLSPAEVGTLVDESCDMQDVVSTVIDLAARGYLQIKEIQAQSFLFFSNKDYEFIKTDSHQNGDILLPHEREFLDALFEYGRSSVKLSDLREKFYIHLPAIRKAIYQSLTDKKLFVENPESVRFTYSFWAAVIFGLGVLVVTWASFPSHMAVGLGLLFSAVIVFVLGRYMPARTKKGWQERAQCLGFQRFVRLAEKDRIAVLAKDDPTIFGRLLPFAMVLGAADLWAEAFHGLLSQPPTWYVPYGSGNPDYTFSSRNFVHDLGQGMNTMGHTFASAPTSSAGSGGSGFSGGFSGGGFGGGGGGSW